MMRYKKLLLELIVLINLYYISTVTIVPPSETIEVIEGGDYQFGLEDDNLTNFCNCMYKSNLDNDWTSFEISKPYNACLIIPDSTVDPSVTTETFILEEIFQEKASDKNVVTNTGRVQWCGINVKNVDDQGPTKWTIKPDDWNETYTETVDFHVDFFYAVPLLYESITILEGESFFQYLNSPLKFESCSVIFNGNTKSLNVESEETDVLKTNRKRDQKLSERISSIGRGLCGFKLKDVVQTDYIKWTLTGVTNDNKKYRAIFKPMILKYHPDSELHTEKIIEVGKYELIKCGKGRVNYCKLYDPKGNLVFTLDGSDAECSYTINTFQVDNYGIWKCVTGNKHTMKSVQYTFKYTPKELPFMHTWVENKGDYMSLGCQLRNVENRYAFSYCKMTTPDQQYFILQPGSLTERYIALGTDLKNLTCAMEMKMPLKDNENGMWKCETDRGSAFINVGTIAKVDYKKYSKLTTRLGQQNVLIQCEVPYYSIFCYIKDPNGTRYSTKENYDPWLGKCSYKIDKVEVVHNGTWTCSFAQKNGMPDDEIVVEVTIADVLSYNPEVKATEDHPIYMSCNSGGLPIQYCQFIDPDGKSYYIDDTVNSTYITYYGKGLDYGECGVKIINAATADSGNWSCVLKISNDRKEISARISLEVSPNLLSGSNLTLILGVTIGTVAITSLFTIITIRTIRQRRRGRLEIPPTQPLRDSLRHDDQEDIFSLDASARGYSNPQIVRDDTHAHQY